MKSTAVRTILATCLLLAATTAVVHADAATTFYGTTKGQPTFNRPSSLGTLSGEIVRYSVQPFFPNDDASCFIMSIQEEDFDGYIFLYRNGFDPENPLVNLIGEDDDGPDHGTGQSRLDLLPLDFNDNYYLVTAGFDASEFGTFSNQIVCDAPATRILAGDDDFGTGNFDGRVAEVLGGRFRISVTGENFSAVPFVGKAVPLASTDSAIFWFFQPANFELLIKMVDGCSLNDRYWVFYAATTNVAFTIRVEDTFADETVTYTNILGSTSNIARTDSDAFATCP
jgi:hypothetical protein